jgi:hypothetical protein
MITFFLFAWDGLEAQGGFNDLVAFGPGLAPLLEHNDGEIWAIKNQTKPVKIAEHRRESFHGWVTGDLVDYAPGWYCPIKGFPAKRFEEAAIKLWERLAARG